MIVLSLFDGMACGYEALKRAGIYVTKYYASEIDKYAMMVAKKNHPDIIHLGDVNYWAEWDIERPDLIIGGSPCQGFSFAGKQLAFDDPRSKLFFTMTDIIDYYKPRFKLLENVKMKKVFLNVMTDFMNCGEPHFINSALVSAQNRQRFYWYNWDAPDPEDKGLLLKDIIEQGAVDREKSLCIDANYHKGGNPKQYFEKSRRQLVGVSITKNGIRPYKNDGRKGSFSEIGTIATLDNKVSTVTSANIPKVTGGAIRGRFIVDGKRQDHKMKTAGLTTQRIEVRDDGRTNALTTVSKDSICVEVDADNVSYRKLTVTECERLQTLPDGYTDCVSNTQRYRMIGNGWTVDVIAHLLRHMPLNELERMQLHTRNFTSNY